MESSIPSELPVIDTVYTPLWLLSLVEGHETPRSRTVSQAVSCPSSDDISTEYFILHVPSSSEKVST